MPVELLTDEQVATYGRFEGSPTRAELERSFFLNDADRELVEQRRRDPNRLGFGLLLKFFELEGRFPRHDAELPRQAVEYIAEQVRVEPSALASLSHHCLARPTGGDRRA